MIEIRMTADEIKTEIDYEDSVGVNTLLQNILALNEGNEIDLDNENVQVFKVLNEKGEMTDYKIRDKNGNDIQL